MLLMIFILAMIFIGICFILLSFFGLTAWLFNLIIPLAIMKIIKLFIIGIILITSGIMSIFIYGWAEDLNRKRKGLTDE